jgi:Tfp pilus assembly protein PilN
MRQINLLPPEIAARRRARQVTALLALGGVALLALLALVYGVQAARLAGERSRLEAARRQTASLERQVAQLRSFADLQQTLRTKEQLLGRLTANEVRWSVILADVSLQIPAEVWLTSFSGSVQAEPQPTQPGQPRTVGSIQMSGMTFTHLDVAKWLVRLAGIREFAFPYLSLSSRAEQAGQQLVQFNATVDLSEAALRRNQPGGARQP